MTLWGVALIAALWFGAGVVYGWWKWSGGNHCRHRKLEEIPEDELRGIDPFRVRCQMCGQLLFGLVGDDVPRSRSEAT